jgi:hypothetical protein
MLGLTRKEVSGKVQLKMFKLTNNELEVTIELPPKTVQFTQCPPHANELHTLDIF